MTTFFSHFSEFLLSFLNIVLDAPLSWMPEAVTVFLLTYHAFTLFFYIYLPIFSFFLKLSLWMPPGWMARAVAPLAPPLHTTVYKSNICVQIIV